MVLEPINCDDNIVLPLSRIQPYVRGKRETKNWRASAHANLCSSEDGRIQAIVIVQPTKDLTAMIEITPEVLIGLGCRGRNLTD